mmetsp:Transcript_38929/g.96691  ORF Transcript_38929/g.96691 Transcript_38929/m.96691 type:complete len:265 (+) Transcript_38929:2000-2794(+)
MRGVGSPEVRGGLLQLHRPADLQLPVGCGHSLRHSVLERPKAASRPFAVLNGGRAAHGVHPLRRQPARLQLRLEGEHRPRVHQEGRRLGERAQVRPQVGREDRERPEGGGEPGGHADGGRRLGVRRHHQGAAAALESRRLPPLAGGVREGPGRQLPHRLHHRLLQPPCAQLQDRRGGQAPHEADRGEDHPCDRHNHRDGHRARLPRAAQAPGAEQAHRGVQELVRQPGASLHQLLRAHRGEQEQGGRLWHRVDSVGSFRCGPWA